MRHKDPRVQKMRERLAIALCEGASTEVFPGSAKAVAEYMDALATHLAILLVAEADAAREWKECLELGERLVTTIQEIERTTPAGGLLARELFQRLLSGENGETVMADLPRILELLDHAPRDR
jgi:hypothetical protein